MPLADSQDKNINGEIMLRCLGLGVVLSTVIRGGISLAGIEFGDNFGQEYLTAENGIAVATTEVTKSEFGV